MKRLFADDDGAAEKPRQTRARREARNDEDIGDPGDGGPRGERMRSWDEFQERKGIGNSRGTYAGTGRIQKHHNPALK